MTKNIISQSGDGVNDIRRAALYIRVSTDEQARKGYSLPAQREALEAYAKGKNLAVTGLYVDDGISAHQAYTKRPSLMRMLSDVESGRIDTILFIKLDRWFRSVKEYYKMQDILDKHHVTWNAILEDYDTESSTGKMMVNFMLTIAQAESDRTSDRIKFVFENKVARGEAICGTTPTGYKIENHKLVPDENAEAVQGIFRHYLTGGSIRSSIVYAREQWGLSFYPGTLSALLKNKKYIGEYRGNPDYCTPIISRDDFNTVQTMLSQRSIRVNTQTGNVYIFTGLLICRSCGKRMVACCDRRRSQQIYYRCQGRANYHSCTHKKQMRESSLEEYLLAQIDTALSEAIKSYEITLSCKAQKRSAIDTAAIKRKLDKLKTLYLDDLITLDEYRADRADLQAQLDAAQEQSTPSKTNIAALRDLLSGDWQSAYQLLDRDHRRQFWRSIIAKIILDDENNPDIYFNL